MKLEFFETQYDNIDTTFLYEVGKNEYYEFFVDRKIALENIFEMFDLDEIKHKLKENTIEFNPFIFEDVRQAVKDHMFIFKFDLQDYYKDIALQKYYTEL